MIKALWLTSWYPNRLDTQNGDFIQRHAKAVSLYAKVDVIHLEADKENILPTEIERSVVQHGSLIETIVLYKLSAIPLIGKAISWLRYIALFKKEISLYLKNNGLPDIVHVHVPMKAGLLALWLKRKYGLNFIVTEHWNIYKSQAKDEFSTRNFFFRYFTKKILKEVSLFLPVSKDLGRRVSELTGITHYEAVPNCVDTKLFFYQDKKKTEAFTFIHPSTLNFPKNPEAIISAFIEFSKKYPSARLLMLGEIPAALEEFIRKENISSHANIIFTGLAPYSKVAEMMQQSQALLMFSRYENMPCVVLEALCCGLPVVSSAVGGIPEVINESNGILTHSYTNEALVEAMEKLYNEYENYDQQKIAKNAAAAFSYEAIGKMIVDKYYPRPLKGNVI